MYKFQSPSPEQIKILKQIVTCKSKQSLELSLELQKLSSQGALSLQFIKQAFKETPVKRLAEFYEISLPAMAVATLQCFDQNPKLPILEFKGRIEIKKSEVYQLLSLSFFNMLRLQFIGNQSPYFNIQYLLNAPKKKEKEMIEKLKCLIHYFIEYSLHPNEKNNLIIEKLGYSQEFHKQFFNGEIGLDQKNWESSIQELSNVEFSRQPIEHHNESFIVNFADKQIGGMTLWKGCVQEEIILITRPEAIVAIFLVTNLSEHQALLVKNALTYSSYEGYGKTFKFKTQTPKNQEQQIIFLDAKNYRYNPKSQFQNQNIFRDLNKAFIGFSLSDQATIQEIERPISSGRWGCGIFRGDIQLKLVLQWLALSQSKAKNNQNYKGILIFSTFGNDKYNFGEQIKKIKEKYKTVGQVIREILKHKEKESIIELLNK